MRDVELVQALVQEGFTWGMTHGTSEISIEVGIDGDTYSVLEYSVDDGRLYAHASGVTFDEALGEWCEVLRGDDLLDTLDKSLHSGGVLRVFSVNVGDLYPSLYAKRAGNGWKLKRKSGLDLSCMPLIRMDGIGGKLVMQIGYDELPYPRTAKQVYKVRMEEGEFDEFMAALWSELGFMLDEHIWNSSDRGE